MSADGVIEIRLAASADLAAINAIYNHYVPRSTCTYQDEPASKAERVLWLREHASPRFPATVAVENGEVVGWASLSPFRTRAAYRHTVENSIYIRHDRHRRGIGRLLLADLIVRARAAGHHTIVAAISADQTASVKLHEAFGFVETGRLREVGYKFDTWLDVVYMQLMV
jgi:L-amino acid N-acyltransferase YncA